MVRYALLGLLREERDYGYRLKRRFDERVGTLWHLNIGQVYQTLRALQRAGLVVEIDGEETNEPYPGRRMFELTPKGQRVLERWLARPPVRPRPVRDETLIRLLVLEPERLAIQHLGHGTRFLGNAEVDQFYSHRLVEEDVLRLDIEMDHSALVQVIESRCNLLQKVRGAIDINWPVPIQFLAKRKSRHELQHYPRLRLLVGFMQVIDLGHAGVGEKCHSPCFMAETGPGDRVVHPRGLERLEGYQSPRPEVASPVDQCHTPGTDRVNVIDLVMLGDDLIFPRNGQRHAGARIHASSDQRRDLD
jgi:DNA-binding PadR family transcriptional regulator